MARYENDYDVTPNRMNVNHQRDLVLSINEFCFLQNKTNGSIRSHVGPLTMTISAQEALVVFNTKTKRFEETTNFETAKQLFISAPEGWYVVLKNPTTDEQYPSPGTANQTPSTIKIGTKVNVFGPTSFALYPGQMAKVVKGHRLRSNQYLLARVYDADAANKNFEKATIVNTDGKEVSKTVEKYYAGQLLIIKGTEVSFYMPPTGIEVIPQTLYNDDYVREAITLERLEYAILKNENGEKRYVQGPAVVFPEPTESFVTSPKGGVIFRALELSPISGIYVKVIADYKDEYDIFHPTGEELFITGNDQMIYYPRPEHAMIQYDGKYMHHAIAIPNGEGRYILDRLTGNIKTIVGPQMYLPDPRTEVVVKRKLTDKECTLFYPGNLEVLAYNQGITEKAMEKKARLGDVDSLTTSINNAYSTSNQEATLAIFEANANISRGVSYTKPRTITLDTKYEGVVNINVWTGYAVNVVSKTGQREIVVGPASRILDYDETLETIKLSTGTPKTLSNTVDTVYLRLENNKITDSFIVQTKDFVNVRISLNSLVSFLPEHKDKWFSIENYVHYFCLRVKNLVKTEVKKYTIEEFYGNSTEILQKTLLGENKTGTLFEENGMFVKDVEIASIEVEKHIADMLDKNQKEIISRSLELSDAKRVMEIKTELAKYEREQIELNHNNKVYEFNLEKERQLKELALEEKIKEEKRIQKEAELEAQKSSQAILDAIHLAKLERDKKEDDVKIETEKKLAEIEKARQEAYANTIKEIMSSISPDLIAALESNANADMLNAVSTAMSPIAIANGESIAETTNKLLRGTSLENIVNNFTKNN